MNAVQFIRGIQLFWSNARTAGTPLAELVDTAGRAAISRTQTTRQGYSQTPKDRQTRSYQYPPRGPFPSSSPQGVRYSTSQQGPSTSARYQSYIKATNEEKILSLTHAGLMIMGADASSSVPPSLSSVEKGWKEVQQKQNRVLKEEAQLSNFGPKPAENLSSLVQFYNRNVCVGNLKVQKSIIIEDQDEAIIFERFFVDPLGAFTVPYVRPSTEDSLAGHQVLKNKIERGAFVVEDGCGNGQHLTQLVNLLNKDRVPITAIGTDIALYNIITAKMLVATSGMDAQCQFAFAHALHRASPRAISEGEGQHITLAYRLIPIFNERKIFRYMGKISGEMKPGDLWCGSIALPKGKFYERYTENKQYIRENKIRSISTSFGATTFVYQPDLGHPGEKLAPYFNKKYEGLIRSEVKAADFSNVVLNTYMTREQFESLAERYGFRLAADPVEVDCEDNSRLVVLLQKK